MSDENTHGVEIENRDAPNLEAAKPSGNDLADAVAAQNTPQEAQDALAEAGEGDQQPEAEGEQDGEKEAQRPKGNAWQKRVDQLTKNWKETERQRDELKAKLELIERLQSGEQDGDGVPEDGALRRAPQNAARPMTQAEIDALVEERATQKAAETQFQQKANDWLKTGRGEFKDFDDRCNTVAALGAGERADFLQVVTDLEGGHRVVAELAENPEEAARILALPTHSMTMELTKLALSSAKPKARAISKAPAPIKPVDGTAAVSDEISANDSEEDFYRKREAQMRKKREARYGSAA